MSYETHYIEETNLKLITLAFGAVFVNPHKISGDTAANNCLLYHLVILPTERTRLEV